MGRQNWRKIQVPWDTFQDDEDDEEAEEEEDLGLKEWNHISSFK